MAPSSNSTMTNTTITDPEDCTLSTCSLDLANFTYIPSLSGNSLFLGIFGLVIAFQLFFGIRHKTWGFMVGMFGGVVLEIIGYVARVQMHYNPFTSDPFLMYLVTLTIAPAFLSASIYLCLSRIIVIYSPSISRFRPATYTITFICCDLLSLFLQAAGGAIASIADDKATEDIGINTMIAGLSTQVASLALFMGLCVEYAWACQKNPYAWDARYEDLRISRLWKCFLGALGVATFTIFIRSIFRVAELSGGFHGSLANSQVSYMVLEGGMIAIACLSLTIFHPGRAFQGEWANANFKMRKGDRKNKDAADTERGEAVELKSVDSGEEPILDSDARGRRFKGKNLMPKRWRIAGA